MAGKPADGPWQLGGELAGHLTSCGTKKKIILGAVDGTLRKTEEVEV